ncbi:MAG: DUF362 domain-containing protein [bacterium]
MKKPIVYLARLKDGSSNEAQTRAARKVIHATGFLDRLDQLDMTAIKVHVGEKRNVTYMRPEIVAAVARMVKKSGGMPFITDTATLYKGERENGIKHILHAHAHGFTIDDIGAPFIPVDGLAGEQETEVTINGELNESVKVAAEILKADFLAVISHATGHVASCMGAAIKNVGMGLASRAGKMRQHSTMTPRIKPEVCTNCGKCRKWCPTDAIEERESVSYIIEEKCIGCGECLAVCRFGAVSFNWGVESPTLQKAMAEHAAGVVRNFNDKAVYMNVIVDVTKDCDCINKKQSKDMPDVGIVASNDMVAIDQATIDLTAGSSDKDAFSSFYPELDPAIQVEHARKLGLGSRDYKLETV